MSFTDISIDLETLATKPGAIILTIGACAFNRAGGDIGPVLHVKLDVIAQQNAGMSMDWDTIAWWFRQSEEARYALLEGEKMLPSAACKELTDFHQANVEKGGKTWANSPSFDLVLLEHLYSKARMTPPWKFWDQADIRTLKLLYPTIPVPSPRVAHRADHDAIAQAEFVQAVWKECK